MMADKVESLVSLIYTNLNSDKLKEIHIIPPVPDLESATDISNLLVFEEGHLGLPVNILKIIYKNIYARLLPDDKDEFSSQDIVKYSSVLLIANPKVDSIWNKRKYLILANQLCPIQDDKFSRILLHLFPKASTLYEHRRWLLRHMCPLDRATLQSELDLCLLTAERYANNYYSWSHRQWCLQSSSDFQVYQDDLELTQKWRAVNVSQYCAFSHCQFIVAKLKFRKEDILHEYRDIMSLLNYYPDHLSLWYHKKWTLYQMSKLTDADEECATILKSELREDPADSSVHVYQKQCHRGLQLLLLSN